MAVAAIRSIGVIGAGQMGSGIAQVAAQAGLDVILLDANGELAAKMHFMNPVPLMKLVEIVRGLATSNDTYETTAALADKLGKSTMV